MKISSENADANGNLTFSADIKNTGTTSGKEVAQLYISHPQTDSIIPAKQLKGFEKIELAPGESKTVEFKLNVKDLNLFSEKDQKTYVPNGTYTAIIGKNASDANALTKNFNVTGTLESTLKTVKTMPDGITVHGLIREDGTGLESITKIDSKLSAIMTDEVWVDLKNADVIYQSSDSNIAAVDANGIVTSGVTERYRNNYRICHCKRYYKIRFIHSCK